MINLDHSNRSFASSLTPLRMLCSCQVEAKRPIPLSRAPGMGRASGATGYRREAVAGLPFWGQSEREAHAMTNRRMSRRQFLLTVPLTVGAPGAVAAMDEEPSHVFGTHGSQC